MHQLSKSLGRVCLWWLASLVLLSPSYAAQQTDDRVFDFDYTLKDLPNGLRVVLVKTPYPDIVSLQITVDTGSRNEVEPGKSGFAHFFEHMMFRGTPNYTAEQYNTLLKNAGADQNAYTTDDFTNYHVTFTKKDLELLVKLEADRFQNLSYSEAAFRTEALAVKGEYLKNSANPVSKMLEVIRDNAFTEHTYKHTTIGFLRDIEQMPEQYEYGKEFFSRWYRPEKTTITVVGDIIPSQTLKLIQQYWGSWKRGNYQANIPTEPPGKAAQYQHINWPSPTQPWVVTAFRGPHFKANLKDKPALDLAGELYFGQTSDLYQKLVVNERKVDQLFAFFPDRKDTHLLLIGARLTDLSHAQSVRDDIFQTLALAKTQLVNQSRLDDLKQNLRYSFTNSLDNSETIADILTRFMHFQGTPETINQYYKTIAKLTPTDIQNYAAKYFIDQGRVDLTLANQEQMSGFNDIVSLSQYQASKPTDNPIKAIAKNPSGNLIDVSILFNTGSADDPKNKKGLATLTAMMISEAGSKSRSYGDIQKLMYPIAGSFGARVDKQMTVFSGRVHKDNINLWYDIIIEQLTNPGFRQDDFERLKTQLINGIETDLKSSDDEELGKEVLYQFIYGEQHPFGHLNYGNVSDLKSLTIDDVKSFYQTHYSASQVSLGFAGAIPNAIKASLKRDLSKLSSPKPAATILPKAPQFTGRFAKLVEKQTNSVAVSFGFPIDITRKDKDWVALWLFRSWLGEHRNTNSHLFQKIRESRGMNYGDYAYIEYFPNGGGRTQPPANVARDQQIFQVWIRPVRSNNDALFATRIALYELDRVLENGMSEEDFNSTKNFLYNYAGLLVKSQDRQLGYALDSEFYGVKDFVEYVRDGLKTLTLEEVNRVIRKHIQTQDVKFVFITPDANDLKERLSSNQVSPMTYNSPKPDALLAEDKVIEVLDLAMPKEHISIEAIDGVFR